MDIMGPFAQGKDQELNGPSQGIVLWRHTRCRSTNMELLYRKDWRDCTCHTNKDKTWRMTSCTRTQKCCLNQDAVLDPLPEEEEEPQQELPEAEIKQQEARERRWKDFVQDRKSQNAKNLTFTVPLKSRHNDDLLQAVAKLQDQGNGTPSSTDSYR